MKITYGVAIFGQKWPFLVNLKTICSSKRNIWFLWSSQKTICSFSRNIWFWDSQKSPFFGQNPHALRWERNTPNPSGSQLFGEAPGNLEIFGPKSPDFRGRANLARKSWAPPYSHFSGKVPQSTFPFWPDLVKIPFWGIFAKILQNWGILEENPSKLRIFLNFEEQPPGNPSIFGQNPQKVPWVAHYGQKGIKTLFGHNVSPKALSRPFLKMIKNDHFGRARSKIDCRRPLNDHFGQNLLPNPA